MSGLALLLRRALRTHGRGALGLVLVVGIVGGLSLATLAAARRTASGFTRFLAASDASDITVGLFPREGLDGINVPSDFLATTDPILEEAAELPEVERAASLLGLNTMYLEGPDGRPLTGGPEMFGSLDGRFADTDRVAIVEGRLPDPGAEDEVLVNVVTRDLVTDVGGEAPGRSRWQVESGGELVALRTREGDFVRSSHTTHPATTTAACGASTRLAVGDESAGLAGSPDPPYLPMLAG